MMEVNVSVSCGAWSIELDDIDQLARRAARAALRFGAPELEHRAGEVGILLTDDAAVRTLNCDYRGLDRATNVLSFPQWDGVGSADPSLELLLGDVVIAHGTSSREAVDANKPLSAHLSHLVVHGVLHLLGYDHQCDSDAEIMEPLEVETLRSLSLASPYQ